ncbi:MAG: pyruvate dehydrogenase, partial [Bacteroidetes bacterium]
MDEKDFLIDNKLISKALFIRKFEERLFDLFNKGKIFGTIHTCIGQELIPVCLAEFSTEDDFWLSNHRGHGHYLAKGGDVNLLMAEIMGKSSGCSGGIGGSQHLFSTNFLSNGIQGGMTPLGIGIGFSFKLRNKNSIVIAFIGDGTLGQGILYEAFNLAGSWNIPILFVLENNGYAQSTSFQQTFAGDIKYRSQGFGLNYFNTNNYDLSSLLNTSQTAISYVRNSKKPALLEIKTYRLKAHSKGDDNRKSEEIKKYEELDLLNRMINKIDLDIEKINLLIDSAVEFSENSNETIVFNSNSSILSASTNYVDLIISYGRVNNNIYEALKEGFQNHENLICIGEDIENITSWTEKPYGGAFNVSQDLSAIYKGRVLNTPISEGGIIGVGIGLALTGFLPIVEIMFGDFITLIFDQLVQHASKINQMYGRKIKIPLIIRTPMGGKRGYGPT